MSYLPDPLSLPDLTGSRPAIDHVPDHNDERTALRQAAAELTDARGLTPNLPGRFLPTRPAISYRRFPGWADARTGHNSNPATQDNLTLGAAVGSNVEYGAFWRWAKYGSTEDAAAVITKQTLPSGPVVEYVQTSANWTTTMGSGGVTNAPVGGAVFDGHNSLAIAVDTDGYIHVCGNQHAVPLKYVRSTNPNDPSAWDIPGMVGTEETQVSYPSFIRLASGTLIFIYRDGLSGAGHWCMNRYSTLTKTWTRIGGTHFNLGVLVGSTESAYPWHFAPHPTLDRIATFWTWRDAAIGGQNHDITFAWLTNLDATNIALVAAANANLTPRALPLTHNAGGNIETILSTSGTPNAQNYGTMNSGGADVDADGNPHAVIWWEDAVPHTQLTHVHWNGAAWVVDPITAFDQRWNWNTSVALGYSYPLARAALVCYDGHTYAIYRSRWNGKGGKLLCIDCTDPANLNEFPLFDLNLHDYEPTYNTRAIKERGELRMMVGPSCASNRLDDGIRLQTAGDPEHFNFDDNWRFQLIGVLGIDLDRMYLVAGRAVNVPRLRSVRSITYETLHSIHDWNADPAHAHVANTLYGPPATTSTSPVYAFGTIPIGDDLAGQLLFIKLTGRIATNSVNFSARARIEYRSPTLPAAVVDAATIVTPAGYAANTPTMRMTPWIPIPETGDTPNPAFIGNDSYGFLQCVINSGAGSATATLDIGAMELGILEYAETYGPVP